MTDTATRIHRILTDQFGEAAYPDSANLIGADLLLDVGADSLDTVELVMAVEEEFDVAIPDETAAELKTVGDLVRWIDVQAEE